MKNKLLIPIALMSVTLTPIVMMSCGSKNPFKTEKTMFEAIEAGAKPSDIFEDIQEIMKSPENSAYFQNINWNNPKFENNWTGMLVGSKSQNIWKDNPDKYKDFGLTNSIVDFNKSKLLDFELKDFTKNIPSNQFISDAYRALNTWKIDNVNDEIKPVLGLRDVLELIKHWLNFMEVNQQYNLIKLYQQSVYLPEYLRIKANLNKTNTQSRQIEPTNEELNSINKKIQQDWVKIILTNKSDLIKVDTIDFPPIPLIQILSVGNSSYSLLQHIITAANSGDYKSIPEWAELVEFGKRFYKLLHDKLGLYQNVSYLSNFEKFDVNVVDFNEISLFNLNPAEIVTNKSPWATFSLRDFEGDINTIRNTQGVKPRLGTIFPWIEGNGELNSTGGVTKLKGELILQDYSKIVGSLKELLLKRQQLDFIRILINHIRSVYKQQKIAGISIKTQQPVKPDTVKSQTTE